MAACPRCGFGNDDGAGFCGNPNCRADLRVERDGRSSLHRVVTPSWTHSSQPQQPERPPSETPVATPTQQGWSAARRVDQPPDDQRRGVGITMEPANLHVEPGGVGQTTVTVRNRGTRVEQFRLGLTGPLSQLVHLQPAQLSVFPDDEQTVAVTFTVPRAPWPPAGRAPFQVSVRSDVHPDVSGRADGSITVGRFDSLQAMLEPEMTRGRKPGLHRVHVVNAGNAPVRATVRLTDTEGELAYEPSGFSIPMGPGATDTGEVRVGAAVRWFGRTLSLPFTAAVAAEDQSQPILLHGMRRQLPRFPWWIPTAAVVAVAIILTLIALRPAAVVPTLAAQIDPLTATSELEAAGYVVSPIPKSDPSIPPDRVIGTMPVGGSTYPKGKRVQLLISTGPCVGACPVKVPPLQGLTRPEAEDSLRAADLTVSRWDEKPDERAAGQVISSDPPSGTDVAKGSAVLVAVSLGKSTETTEPPTPPGPAPNPDPKQLKIPELTRKPLAEAQQMLEGLGLSVTSVRMQSNAAPLNTVLSSNPKVGSTVKAGDKVELTVAEPTGVGLLDLASAARWFGSGSPVPTGSPSPTGAAVAASAGPLGPLPFPGTVGSVRGYALVDPAASLEDGSTTKVLVTHPGFGPGGTINGTFTLPKPIIAGDHLRALVGFQSGSDDAVDFVLLVNGKELKRVSDVGTDSKLKVFDADLSSVKGATEVQIKVLAGTRGDKDLAVWKDLRIEGQIG